MRRPPLVKVVWMDPQSEASVEKGQVVGLREISTVGWLTKRGKILNVAAEDADTHWRDVTSIHRALVVRIVPIPEPEET